MIGQLAGIIALLGFVPYVIAILRGETRPNRASWFIWFVMGVALGLSYFFSGARQTIWVPISYIIGPLIISILSVKYGEGGWTKFDRNCLIGAGVGAVLWAIFREPLVALCINLFIDILGALPTVKKAYLEPEKEDRTAWALWVFGNLLNLFAIDQLTFAVVSYPAWMFVGSGIIAFLVIVPRRRKI